MADAPVVVDVTHEVTKKCLACGKEFSVLAAFAGRVIECGSCVDELEAKELAVWKSATRKGIEGTVRERLTAYGMADGELEASTDKVPKALKRSLPSFAAHGIVDGLSTVPEFGFGLVGGQGAGKTMCLAAMLKARTFVILERVIAERQTVPDPSQSIPWHINAAFSWVNWPRAAAWAKNTIMLDKGSQIVEEATLRWCTTSLLVLDDLGRERVSAKAYDEDFATGLLDRIIDHRNRYKYLTLWTSNLGPRQLATRYGAAMTSRLLGLSPVVEVPKLADLRLAAE